jgi:DNA repair protein RecO (recombination protein O)
LDPILYVLASYFTELVEIFFRPTTGRGFFLFLREAFHHLSQADLPWPLLKGKFELGLLETSGFSPSLEVCVRCQEEVDLPKAFSFSEGGVVCGLCRREEDHALSAPAWALLRHLRLVSFRSLTRIKVSSSFQKEALGLTETFLRRIADREINALRVLKEMV